MYGLLSYMLLTSCHMAADPERFGPFILGDRVVVCVWAVDLYVADFVSDGCRS